MSTLNKTADKKSSDPIDQLIFEKGLRIAQVFVDKKMKLLMVILNNSKVLRIKLTDYKSLEKASQQQLNKWQLISNGVGIEWEELKEDLSLKGMIKSAAISAAIDSLEGKKEFSFVG